jgi:hypothetical protein
LASNSHFQPSSSAAAIVHGKAHHAAMKKRRPRDLTNQTFGRLVAKDCVGMGAGKHRKWRCVCECGNEIWTESGHLTSGDTQSCGCLVTDTHRTHGMSKTDVYQIWNHMLARCLNERDPAYSKYGGAGVEVQDSWRDFENFYSDVGPRPSKSHSLDRWPNNDGNYESGNVRWATQKEQQNNRRNNVLITLSGQTKTLAQWSEFVGVKYSTIRQRIKAYGWSEREAIFGKSIA